MKGSAAHRIASLVNEARRVRRRPALLYARRVTPSRRTSRTLLWLVFLLTVPVPYYLGGFELAPVARLLLFAGLVLAVVATEGAAGYQGVFALLAAVQAILWPLLLLLAARLGAAALQRLVPEHLRAAVLAGAVASLLAVAFLPIYSTELSSRGARSSLAGLLD
jgi:hypothetical protein